VGILSRRLGHINTHHTPYWAVLAFLVSSCAVVVAAGVVAAELAALITLSFSLRRWIGGRNWRRLHWATYLVFVLGTVHGLAAGTDSSRPWALGLYLGAVGAVTAATAWRALARPTRPVRERSA